MICGVTLLAITQPCRHSGIRVDCAHCKARLVSVCAAFEPEDLDPLQAMAHPICFSAGETLFLENDPSDAAYTVTEGVVRLYRIFADGRRQIVSFLLPGDFIAAETHGRHAFSADAITQVTLCRFAQTQFAAVMERRPHVLQRLYEMSAQELIRAHEHMIALGQRSATEKIAWFLVTLRDKWARSGLASNEIPIPMLRQDIADYLGLTIETVSRTLSSLARDKKIIVMPQGVKLTDPKAVERLAAT
jgi:CRP/FNR family transcriptional regulator, anaerobic regulatory protein